MKLLVVHPGSQFSTGDVCRGLIAGLRANGHEVGIYALTDRIAAASEWVALLQRRARRRDPNRPKLTHDERMNRIFDEAAKDVLAMALDNRVDGVLVISAMFVPGQTLWRLKQAGIPVGLVLTESPYDDERHVQLAPLATVVWTNERASVDRIKAVQPNTHYLAAAYDPALHTAIPQAMDTDYASHDVVFVGTAFRERLDLLAAVDWTGIDLGLYGNFAGGVGGHRPNAKCRRILDPYVRGGLMGNAETCALYRNAKIGLNIYRTSIDFQGKRHIDAAESMNPRAYELAAVGCFQMSDWREEIDDVMGAGHVSAFASPDDLRAQIDYYLANPDERRAMATGARWWVEDHTFQRRAGQLVTQFQRATAGTYAVAYG
jgi:spore maturation protein CgeB